MNIHEFIQKWSRASLTERSASHEHFLDLCEVLGHSKPAEADPKGEWFTFEKGAAKRGGGDGWADVWKRGFFGWEYKGRHKNLETAYDQLLKYRESLENPPLLVVCDMDRIVVHTNFTGTRTEIHDIPLAKLAEPKNFEILRAVFESPAKLKPGITIEAITQEAAGRVGVIAESLRSRGLDAHEVARFLDRIVFALFAEDVGLLPPEIFSRLIRQSHRDPELFRRFTAELFQAMATGDYWALDRIRHFNGNLFNVAPVLTLTVKELESIAEAAKLDWGSIDPSIFGTLFERGMDPDKRSQLGAHYTSREDIETLVDPVVMQPLRREWAEVQRTVESLLANGKKNPTGKEKIPEGGLQGTALKKARLEADLQLRRFWERLAHVKVLDPACGSGNFLYVTLQKLKDLEKEVILYGMEHRFSGFPPLVGPWQLHGIEINPYAFELAQMSVWIGYLQWIKHNGFGEPEEPVLRLMDTFQCKDAILDLSDPEDPREPEWPKVDFIVGNPPFLVDKKMRSELGDVYTEALRRVYRDRIAETSDLCCYWFERARLQLQTGKCSRVGLLATQSIRGIFSRGVLDRIKETGGIFFAVSDRPWLIEGAVVHVSMVGFDKGEEQDRILDGRAVIQINSDLTSHIDVTRALRLPENKKGALQGVTPAGPFIIGEEVAFEFLLSPSPNSRPNSDVLRPYLNADDLAQRSKAQWIVDFGINTSLEVAAQYELPFRLVEAEVRPFRASARSSVRDDRWWLHLWTRHALQRALADFEPPSYIATTRVGKQGVFAFVPVPTLPSDATVAFTKNSYCFFGVLQSRCHRTWAFVKGSQLRERESGFRYTPTTCFETFPFPSLTEAQETAITGVAKELVDVRNRWLNPPEWTREEVLEFPGSMDGPWARYLHDPDARGIGTVRYPRLVPTDDEAAEKLRERTLTNLYNQRPTWLDLAHRKLDEAVFAAYGWSPDISDEEILEKLLALNLERAG